MAVGKEAPVPDIFVVSAASRASLAAAVAEFTETIASLPVTTVKKRLKNAEIVLPEMSIAAAANGFSPSKPIEPGIVIEGLEEK